jgi:hypothetical protein
MKTLPCLDTTSRGFNGKLRRASWVRDAIKKSLSPFIRWYLKRFCGLKGHEMFCEVERSYIEDGFNLYGLRACVSNFSDCLDLILDRIGPDDSDDSHLTQNACTLYGLIHARYIITAHGLDAMYNKVRTTLRPDCARCCRLPFVDCIQSTVSCSTPQRSLERVRWCNARVSLFCLLVWKTKSAPTLLRYSVLNVSVYTILQWFGIGLTTEGRATVESTALRLERRFLICFSWHLAISYRIRYRQTRRMFLECLAFVYTRVRIKEMNRRQRHQIKGDDYRMQTDFLLQGICRTCHEVRLLRGQRRLQELRLCRQKILWGNNRGMAQHKKIQAWMRPTKLIKQSEGTKQVTELSMARPRE